MEIRIHETENQSEHTASLLRMLVRSAVPKLLEGCESGTEAEEMPVSCQDRERRDSV